MKTEDIYQRRSLHTSATNSTLQKS